MTPRRRWLPGARRTLGGIALAAALVAPVAAAGDARAERPSIVLVILDSLRSDRLGVYGHDRPTSPRIDAFARESVLFERCYAPAPYTISSVTSLLTGLPPDTHGMTTWEGRLPEAHRVLPEVLGEAGYRSLVATRSGVFRGFGLEEEFDVQVIDLDLAKNTKIFRRTWREALRAEAERPEPVFAYFHFLPPHAPYEPPPEMPIPFPMPDLTGVSGQPHFLRALDHGRVYLTPAQRDAVLALYDANIVYADILFGLLLDALDEVGLGDAWVILTSDHGEAFGEHGRWEHNSTVYEEMIRVPLIVRPPGGVSPGRRSGSWSSLLDLYPSILGWAGLDVAPDLPGRALHLEARSDLEPPRVHTSRTDAGANRWAIIHEGFKYIGPVQEPGLEELYDLLRDPEERDNLIHKRPDLRRRYRRDAARQRKEHESRIIAVVERGEMDAATEANLRALGYLGP